MDKLKNEIGDAGKRMAVVNDIMRWIWLVNATVTIVGIFHQRYDLVAVAAFTWVLALVAAGASRRAGGLLSEADETVKRSTTDFRTRAFDHIIGGTEEFR